MEPEGSLPYSQEPSTGPYPEPDQSPPEAYIAIFSATKSRVTWSYCLMQNMS
jgi:hypothetical protein